jgi:hypothetical protein
MKKFRRTTATALALALTLTLAPAALAGPRFVSFSYWLAFDVPTRVAKVMERVANRSAQKTQKIASHNDLPAPPKP